MTHPAPRWTLREVVVCPIISEPRGETMSMSVFDAQWAPLEVGGDGLASRAFGPLTISVRVGAGDWRLEIDRDGPAAAAESLKPLPSLDVARFAGVRGERIVAVAPALLDRSVVARPETPVYVLAGESVRLFVSTPLVVQVFAGASPTPLTEAPTVRLQDTWFGATTRAGELCYASRTNASLSVDGVKQSPVRAITGVHIANRGSTHVRVERVRIPCPFLSLFRDEADLLWTEELRLVRTGDGDGAEPELARAPEAAGQVRRLAAARREDERSYWLRSLGAMLG